MRTARWTVAALTLAALAGVPARASSQGLGELRRRAAEAKKALEARKKAADDSVKAKATADSVKQAKAAADAAAASAPSAATPAAPAAPAPANPPAKADAKIWENYDFVPGNRVIFFTDFSEDKVGNFARGLKYVAGPMDVVERDGVKMLRSTGRSTFLVPVGKVLPERFTLEIGIIAPKGHCCGYEMLTFEGGAELDRDAKSANPNWHSNGTLIIGGGQTVGTSSVNHPEAMQTQLKGQVAHVRVLMDSGYFKMYTNERRMYNIPELPFKRDSVIRVFVNGAEEADVAVFLTSIRVAESETDVLYDALTAKGRWATQGILFATGKAELQPESRPVLKEIASTMKEHGDLKILIEGHTDNVGAAASNLSLSDARAAAVKAALVADFGLDGGRITTKGLGDTKPSVPNATAAGKAQNRRVEIVKQ
jgi:outer membrane protein OmpA-like peptidoglycan-associated protein